MWKYIFLPVHRLDVCGGENRASTENAASSSSGLGIHSEHQHSVKAKRRCSIQTLTAKVPRGLEATLATSNH